METKKKSYEDNASRFKTSWLFCLVLTFNPTTKNIFCISFYLVSCSLLLFGVGSSVFTCIFWYRIHRFDHTLAGVLVIHKWNELYLAASVMHACVNITSCAMRPLHNICKRLMLVEEKNELIFLHALPQNIWSKSNVNRAIYFQSKQFLIFSVIYKLIHRNFTWWNKEQKICKYVVKYRKQIEIKT